MHSKNLTRGVLALTACGSMALASTPSLPAQADEAPSGTTHVTRVGSYNVLGSHDTDPGGANAAMPTGRARMTASLQHFEKQLVSVVALQELENPQASAIRADGDWGLFRATPNEAVKTGAGGNAVMWRKKTWSLTKTAELTIPYAGHDLHLPVVTLKNRANGKLVTVVSVQNPADVAGRNSKADRLKIRGLERARLKMLKKAGTRTLVVMGDFNENKPVRCGLTASGIMRDASGYKHRNDGTCPTPGDQGTDWIFGSGHASFTQWQQDSLSKAQRWSDHPMVYAKMRY
ncbi:endonuclease/exonuclease/phosphatase family protein [Luteipulveratus mongoliensis]|uniref:Endonuclease/exonuclease/phosphatase domain-containing protein n=1 Tax=Luteipulveratus mongoliensis TaxID=571913 RepID=A0A0K1JF01_9MICO|nr:endonuclease/exonuclease/phosphatase family protein [Luteipulveratus mongoliensis]AKU15279.1 hypothetical protein VV02_04395 [Luteipulveratus mongoliensis]